jgi:hypothetical protein
MPLLEGLDGVNKMSKSLGNYIGIAEPAIDIVTKTMKIGDDLMWKLDRAAQLRHRHGRKSRQLQTRDRQADNSTHATSSSGSPANWPRGSTMPPPARSRGRRLACGSARRGRHCPVLTFPENAV